MSNLSADKVAGYWRLFEDGSPERWKSELKDDGTWHLTFPNGAEALVNRDRPNIDWEGEFDSDHTSTRLWTNSLRYLVDMLDAGDIATVQKLLESFQAFIIRHLENPKALASGSLDHQSSLQLRTLCEVRAWAASRRQEFPEQAMQLDETAYSIVKSVRTLTEALELLTPNNHGVMLGIALLHANALFPETVTELSDNETVHQFLGSTFAHVLGDDGVANENTPIYQGFYVRLLDQIVAYERWAFDTPNADIERFSAIAKEAYRHVMIPGGIIPPIGDASVSRQSVFDYAPGVWASPQNGLFVSSSDDTFFSLVCGYRGVFHKQMDDTSMILWKNGEFLIQDGGLASYDKNDPVAMAIRGQRGHSGLFFTDFDDVLAESVVAYSTSTRTVKSEMLADLEPTGALARVTGKVEFRGTAVQRTATVLDHSRYLIRDEIMWSGGATSPVSRFLLDPAAQLSVDASGALVIKGKRSWMAIWTPGGFSNVNISRGHEPHGPDARGFMSPKNYSTQATTVIDLPLQLDAEGKSKRLLYLSAGKLSEEVFVWPDQRQSFKW